MKTLANMEITQTWEYSSIVETKVIHGFVANIDIDNTPYEVIVAMYPTGWFFKSARKVGGKRDSNFKKETQQQILNYILNETNVVAHNEIARKQEEEYLLARDSKNEEKVVVQENQAAVVEEVEVTIDSVLTKQQLIKEEQVIGTNIEEAVYILSDGTLWDGQFDYGCRGVEHREVELFTKHDRYDGEVFWNEVMVTLGLVMLIPENKQVLIHPKNKVTREQQIRINEAVFFGYEVADFN